MHCDENALRDATRAYWSNRNPEKIKRIYIPRLLEQELAFADKSGTIEATTCDVLVLLVGHSLEPLLQVVRVFQPSTQIVLVLNQTYDTYNSQDGTIYKMSGEDFADQVMELIGKLPENLIGRHPFQPYNTNDFMVRKTADQPATVFHLLQENLKAYIEQRQRVIIDITGAKKSMVAGAFLYAAYTNTSISYVDFGEYDPQEGRPYGYTCRIGLLRDPYEAFRLRDWERVRQLYQSCQFRAAREIVQGRPSPQSQIHPGLIQWMEQEAAGERYFTREQVQVVKHLAAVLEVYELWDNGDFCQAFAKAQALAGLQSPFEPPLAVRVLGSFWPHAVEQTDPHEAASQLLTGLKMIETGTYALPVTAQHFTIYARDEIAKIHRLILFNEDYRSALLRAVGLGESLLKARWVSLWRTRQIEVAPKADGPYTLMHNAPPEVRSWEDAIERELLQAFKAEQLIHGLRYADINKKYLERNSWFDCKRGPQHKLERRRFYLRRTLSTPWIDEAFLFSQFKDLRDKAIHTYLSVPKSVAEEALRIARASLEDYEQQWASHLDDALADKIGTTCDYVSLSQGQPCGVCGQAGAKCAYRPLPWKQLCQVCGIDFLPPVPSGEEAL